MARGIRKSQVEFAVPMTRAAMKLVRKAARLTNRTPRQWAECVLSGYASETVRRIELSYREVKGAQ